MTYADGLELGTFEDMFTVTLRLVIIFGIGK